MRGVCGVYVCVCEVCVVSEYLWCHECVVNLCVWCLWCMHVCLVCGMCVKCVVCVVSVW